MQLAVDPPAHAGKDKKGGREKPAAEWVARKTDASLNRVNDVAEYVADRGPEDRQDDDDDNSHQDENQRIFYEALPFLHLPEHGFSSFPEKYDDDGKSLSKSSYNLFEKAIN
jgi:hypothetical protein